MRCIPFVLALLLATTVSVGALACDSWTEHRRAFQVAHEDAELFGVADVNGFYGRWKSYAIGSEPATWNIERPDRIFYFRSPKHATSQVLFVESDCITFWGFYYNWQLDTVLLPANPPMAEQPGS